MFSKWISLIIPFSGSGQYGILIGIGSSVISHSIVYSNGLAVSICILSSIYVYTSYDSKELAVGITLYSLPEYSAVEYRPIIVPNWS